MTVLLLERCPVILPQYKYRGKTTMVKLKWYIHNGKYTMVNIPWKNYHWKITWLIKKLAKVRDG